MLVLLRSKVCSKREKTPIDRTNIRFKENYDSLQYDNA